MKLKEKKVKLIWKNRVMQHSVLLLSSAIIRFYFKIKSILLKNKLLILSSF